MPHFNGRKRKRGLSSQDSLSVRTLPTEEELAQAILIKNMAALESGRIPVERITKREAQKRKGVTAQEAGENINRGAARLRAVLRRRRLNGG
jgi:hypothetical protein